MGKKRKRKNKPTPQKAKKQEQMKKSEDEKSEDKLVDTSENPAENIEETEKVTDADESEKDITDAESKEEEKRKSRRQKIAEIDRSLAKTLEAREAGKKKDLRDPITRFFQDIGKKAVAYKQAISFGIMIIIVVLFLIAYNVITSSGMKVTEWSRLSAENNIDELQNLARLFKGKEIESEVYRKLISALEKDTERDIIIRLKSKIDAANNFIEKFDNDDKQVDFCNYLRNKLQVWKNDLEFLQNREEEITKMIEKPEHKTVVLPSVSDDTIEIELVTDYGAFKLELFDRVCPNAVAAFMYLVQDGFYQEDGLGGWIKRAQTSSGVERLVFGEMPAMDYQNQSNKYEDMKDIDERVKKLNKDVWEKKFDARQDGLGWKLPLEPQGIKLKCKKGALLAWLENENEPESASYKFSALLDADDELSGQYMVIGSIKRVFDDEDGYIENKQKLISPVEFDAESLQTATQIDVEGTTINYVLVNRTKAQKRYTELFLKTVDGYKALPSLRYFKQQGEREYIVGSPEEASFVVGNPGMYNLIPEGSYYKNEKNEIVKAEKDIYQPVFDEKTMKLIRSNTAFFPPFSTFYSSFAENLGSLITKKLPVYIDAIDENGEFLKNDFKPIVFYNDLPLKIMIRKKKPPKTEPFVFTRDQESPLYFEGDVNPAGNQPPASGYGGNPMGGAPGGYPMGSGPGATRIPINPGP
ncbi:MAG: peptidylprolyl isomerase [Planctomycetes bacterium]|nr:peptidylprolyl isomerase [Planctomycetota bacterium]